MNIHTLVFLKNQCPQSKACAKTDSLKNAKIGKKNCQNRDFEPRFQGNQNTHNQDFDVYHNNQIRSFFQIDFMKKHKKIAEIFSKNFKIINFVYFPLSHYRGALIDRATEVQRKSLICGRGMGVGNQRIFSFYRRLQFTTILHFVKILKNQPPLLLSIQLKAYKRNNIFSRRRFLCSLFIQAGFQSQFYPLKNKNMQLWLVQQYIRLSKTPLALY